ncbi:hypothetical protein FL966_00895 [Caproiciproducens galactitolivorans]|uniref:Phage gp6-like head-tail connector protein n=1 Tax=Caproiciproducens galactitolivorans TaxID=642589 RepID=A0A4Z0Y6G3_9FIRM|nr:phage head-tail connector protein [Caproiciproducens galactitolivorans]QEY33729.1 hypothetical protein FL966_00895 [Caproiciproducens galactitolivorans]TGJ75488.1 hypothetical protein CAGA_23670 [Caproiciproducens galactitolivorans]
MAVTASEALAIIKSRPATIPDGFSDDTIQSYIDEAKAIMLEYCTLPQNIQEVPDALKYSWVEIATVLMNNSAALTTGTVTSVHEGDSSMSIGSKKTAQAELFDSLSVNNIRIMNSFRTLF